MTNINWLIKTRRKVLKLSQVELAKKSGVSQANVSKIENGVQQASFNAVRKILKALGVQIKFKIL